MRTMPRNPTISARAARQSRPPVLARFLLVLAACAAAACGLPDLVDPDVDPEDVPESEILDLTRTGGDLPLRADGKTQDTLVARIPEGASSRVVTFTTSAGSFLLTPASKTISVRAEKSADLHDSRLVARAVLVADTLPGTAVASAKVGDFTRYLNVPFVR